MEEKLGEILIYQTENGLTDIEVKMQDETVWLRAAFSGNAIEFFDVKGYNIK